MKDVLLLDAYEAALFSAHEEEDEYMKCMQDKSMTSMFPDKHPT